MIYSPKTLAARWHCSRSVVYRLIESGRLPHFKIGAHTIRIRGEDVEAWESTGGNTALGATGSGSSSARPSSAGETKKARTAEDWALSTK
jgi:excisionase family DNA binding protein